ncbi:hypothetical protein [Thalassotalea crassostreae]|uniref:hypothetical protein n=1 Tax=Thalassotalea crassostreae TaxID=1763536 RepID=UPI0012FD640C|nr:hypothetical protein [Thalassotalea crassostreae]
MTRYLFLVLLFFSTNIIAEENPDVKPQETEITPLMIIGVEALFAVNSWMASEDPHTYGGAAALLFPIAGCNELYCSNLIAAESLALYNLSIDDDKTSKSEIFKNNMIAWHIFAGVVGLSEYLIEDKDIKLSFQPISTGGGKIVFDYKF